jgi:phosphopantothenoylcysteine decarboxylase/phosphopantothenate--cysteine ligase
MAEVAILGVSGSVASYRAADLARDLMRAGFEVRVCLTQSAAEFVRPALFEALTGRPCLVGAFEEPVRGEMAHIAWAREASVVVVAPATANTIANLAYGQAVDMLSTLALATTAPLVIAPAMNPQMYASEPTQAAMRILAARAALTVEPTEGDVACGEHGQGKLASNAAIVSAVVALRRRRQVLAGRRVLLTSGPTQEPLDSVRFLSNRSSGKMGAALARAVHLLGGEATVVTGPATAPLPLTARTVRVRTAQEMLEAVLAHLSGQDFVIGAAAVADYRPANPSPGKLRRKDEMLSLELVPNPDVIATAAAEADPETRVIGFAAEPTSDDGVALEKLRRKGLDALAMNDITRSDAGFEAESNELTLLWPDGGRARSGLQSKLLCGIWLMEALANRAHASE